MAAKPTIAAPAGHFSAPRIACHKPPVPTPATPVCDVGIRQKLEADREYELWIICLVALNFGSISSLAVTAPLLLYGDHESESDDGDAYMAIRAVRTQWTNKSLIL